jgi:hypothetical protein
MGSLDFAALGLDAKAAWESLASVGQSEAAKAGAKAAASGAAQACCQRAGEAEPLVWGQRRAKEPAKLPKAGEGRQASQPPRLSCKAAAKEPLTAAVKEPAKSAGEAGGRASCHGRYR